MNVATSVFSQASGLLLETFGYNRRNFMYDREQRQRMEYKVADMQIAQVNLWREDVKCSVELAPKKMAVYLLVIALELNATVIAICKARVPPGVPPWLAACHTLAICSTLVYLIMALWFGLQAFVSAQAYKVRILTQLVRLPVPTWEALEASRTYASAFESMHRQQLIRVPFAMGTQESQLDGGRLPSASSPRVASPPSSPMPGMQAHYGEQPATADPWGLEPRGEGISELLPEVNADVEKQRHIWLVREAGRFYQTYDAFCRISLSAGTSSLAQFFSFFCLTYVLTENAAPVEAWAGMIVFNGISIMLMRIDLLIPFWQFLIGLFLLLSTPILASIVTFISSKQEGVVGRWEFLMSFALFFRGLWFVYYLWLLRVREMNNASFLPMAFKAVLFVDPFAWAKHTGTWFKRLKPTVSGALSRRASFRTSSGIGAWDNVQGATPSSALPSMQCIDSAALKRPEEVASFKEAEVPGTPRSPLASTGRRGSLTRGVSFRPGTFASAVPEEDGDNLQGAPPAQTGTDVHGEKPGLVPWRYFVLNTVFITIMWWSAAVVDLTVAFNGGSDFGISDVVYNSLLPGRVTKIELLGEAVTTTWHSEFAYPHGLSCDPSGSFFATSSRTPDGRASILRGQLLSDEERSGSTSRTVRFAPAAACAGLDAMSQPPQDMSLHGCSEKGGEHCSALVLSAGGQGLVSCLLSEPGIQSVDGAALNDAIGVVSARPVVEQQRKELPKADLLQSWLDDRGGLPAPATLNGNDRPAGAGLLQPEEVSSVQVTPCVAGESGHTEECIVVGTTSRRLVQLAVADSDETENPSWVPRRLLKKDHGEVPKTGAIALFGGRYLGVLRQNASALWVTDLLDGGKSVGTWAMPHPRAHKSGRWTSICAGGDAFYALSDGESPALWRFGAPKELLPKPTYVGHWRTKHAL